MTYVPKFCDEKNCSYITVGGTSTKCALHQEAARVAASVKVVAGQAIAEEPGIRDWDWCEVPGCHGQATGHWEGVLVCERHGKYGTFVHSLNDRILRLQRWRLVLIGALIPCVVVLVATFKGCGS